MKIFNVSRHIENLSRLSKPGDNSRFWIGQFIVIVSTIIGVYLAAYAGFKQAIEFDAMVNKRNTYHLISAMEEELKDNMAIVETLSNTLKRPSMNRKYVVRRNQVGKFVWTAMLESEETFQIPAVILTGVRRYYKNIDVLVGEVKNSQIGISSFIKRVEEEHAKLNASVLPEIEKEKQHLLQIMSELDVSI